MKLWYLYNKIIYIYILQYYAYRVYYILVVYLLTYSNIIPMNINDNVIILYYNSMHLSKSCDEYNKL